MALYPYTLKTGSLKKFLEEISSRGIPQKVTQKYLESVGFKTINDRPIIRILKFISFIDANGVPTDRYKKFRDKQMSATILGEAIKEAYQELFKIYPDAEKKDASALENFFRTNTGLGNRAVKSIVETFNAIASIAEFNENDLESPTASSDNLSSANTSHHSHNLEISLSEGRKVRINLPLNITQLEIDKIKRLLDVLL